MSNKTSSKLHKSVLQQVSPLNTVNVIHNQFVDTPIDKANGNASFIFQQFYALVPVKELGIDCNHTDANNIYIPVHKTKNHVISGHIFKK